MYNIKNDYTNRQFGDLLVLNFYGKSLKDIL